MAHIAAPQGVPGIRSLVMFRPDTGKHLYDLVQILLRGPSPLAPAERELIATHVSAKNNCMFCMNSHAAAARELYGAERNVVDCVINNEIGTMVSNKMKALLVIAGKVQQSGKSVTPEDIEEARRQGAGDRDIHDTVLIAATFSMFNRYVDGLASYTPEDPKTYEEMGKRMTTMGYILPQPKA
jgi:uncharacterized peroxidase-related enzyme